MKPLRIRNVDPEVQQLIRVYASFYNIKNAKALEELIEIARKHLPEDFLKSMS